MGIVKRHRRLPQAWVVFFYAALAPWASLYSLDVPTLKGLDLDLLNIVGHNVGKLAIPVSEQIWDLVFKPHIPDDVKPLARGWAFEVSDPTGRPVYRTSGNFLDPGYLHWDGSTAQGGKIATKAIYTARYFIQMPNGSYRASTPKRFLLYLTSDAAFFYKIQPKRTFRLLPSFSVNSLDGNSQGSPLAAFPQFETHIRALFSEHYEVGLELEATPDLLYPPSNNAYAAENAASVYIGGFLGGAPFARPILTEAPQYIGHRSSGAPALIYGPSTSLEIAALFRYVSLLGSSNAFLNQVLFKGLSFSLAWRQRVGAFQFLLGGDAGYSVFGGTLLLATAKTELVYDRGSLLAPGLSARFEYWNGPSTPNVFSISNQARITLGSVGLICYLRL